MVSSYTFDVVRQLLDRDADPAVGLFHGLRLGSHFQPVFSLANGSVVGHEALLRATDVAGGPLSPQQAFQRAGNADQALLLDRLSRTVHVSNFAAQCSDEQWLFLNINPAVSAGTCATHGRFFGDMLGHFGIPPHRVVVEMLESAMLDEKPLLDSASFYRELGTLIAIDDFGAGHSNFDRIWKLRPHIVKLDRSMLVHASRDPIARRLFPSLTSMLHEIGSLVLMEGVEDESQAMIALDANIDLVQGYYFARPSPTLVSAPTGGASFGPLFRMFERFVAFEQANYQSTVLPYVQALEIAAGHLVAGKTLEEGTARFRSMPKANSCYLLDQKGNQVGAALLAPNAIEKQDPRFRPLAGNYGSVVVRRHYFRRVLSRPQRVQITRPYLSLPSADLCVTFCVAIPLESGTRVLCGDVQWGDDDPTNERSIDTALRGTTL